MRSAALGLLLGGCLIVRTTEEQIVESACPSIAPELLADAEGPFVISGDTIYFIGANEMLSRVSVAGGQVSELMTDPVLAARIAADTTYLYWASDDAIVRKPLTGGTAQVLAEGYANVTELLVDDTSVVWASSTGLDRWSKTSQTITSLHSASLVLGLGVYAGVYYFSDTHGAAVRRTPPTEQIATSLYPASLVVDEAGVYFFEAAEQDFGYAGQLRLVPRDGGSVVTTASDLSPLMDLTFDDVSLYFAVRTNSDYRIKQVSRFGGEVRTLACGAFEDERIHIANTEQFVYWADGRGLYRIDKTANRPD